MKEKNIAAFKILVKKRPLHSLDSMEKDDADADDDDDDEIASTPQKKKKKNIKAIKKQILIDSDEFSA